MAIVMKWFKFVFTAVALAGACLSAKAQLADCPTQFGPAAAITGDSPTASPLEIVLAASSATWSRQFRVTDAQGRALRHAEVEFLLPDLPQSLVFIEQDGSPSATPKRALATVSDCIGPLPRVLAGPESGTFTATARVGPGFSGPVPVRVVTGQSPIVFERGAPVDIVAANGSVVAAGGSAEWSDGTQGGPLAGVPITVTATSSTMSPRFENGSSSIVVSTDAFGGAVAPLVLAGGPGTVEVRATYPGGALAASYRYIALDAPRVEVAGASVPYGSMTSRIQGRVRYAGFPCELAASSYLLASRVRVFVDEVPIAGAATYPAQCSGDAYEATFTAPIAAIPFGDHPVSAEVFDHPVLPAGRSDIARLVVAPAANLASSTGRGSIRLGTADPEYSGHAGVCAIGSAQAVSLDAGSPPGTGPANVDLPYGALRFELSDCNWSSTFGGVPPPPGPPSQRVLLEVGEDLPPGTTAWAFGPTPEDSRAHWYELRTTILGRFAQFEVSDGGRGDESLSSDRVIRSLIALGAPRYSAIAGDFQDLWWAGPVENGWGVSLTQHRDALFAALFVYDAAGDPRWLVMSGGRWDEARSAYSGALYRPRGSPLPAYDAGAFRVGAPVGSVRFVFTSYDTLTLEYVVDGVGGVKHLRRQAFGRPHPFPAPRFDDLWWGGPAQDGWGLALAQQFQTVFGVLYAYDSQGETTWLVASDLSRTDPGRLQGKLYRTRGPSWPGAPYDASRLVVTEVGTLTARLFDGWESGYLTAAIDGEGTISKDIGRQPF